MSINLNILTDNRMNILRKTFKKNVLAIIILIIAILVWIIKLSSSPCGPKTDIFKRLIDPSNKEIINLPCRDHPDSRTVQ